MVSDKELKKYAEEVISSLGKLTISSVTINDITAELKKFIEYGVPLNYAKKTLIKKYKLDLKKEAENILSKIGKGKKTNIT